MADQRLYVHVLLDRSGSMEDCRDRTIGAFNEYVSSLKSSSKAGTRLSLTTFDSESIDIVFDTMRIGDVPKLSRDTYVPRGMTPLFDAVGQTVAKIDKVTRLPDERTAFAILTDGLENASTEFTVEGIRKILTERQEKQNWLVLYLGANQDAWSAGAQIGIGAVHCMDFATEHTAAAMDAMQRATGRYRSAPADRARGAAAFTAKERAQSKGETS
jgi:hypothetical protein